MPESARSTQAATRWSVRTIPLVLLAVVAFATYLVIPHVCINYLILERNRTADGIALIVLYSIFLFLGAVCYLRTLITVKYNPGLVPLAPRRNARNGNSRGLPDADPDSPGLETFYSRDVFVCESDGRPRWCHHCEAWKPDRSHHSRDLNRCVLKMDHFCPWVGGMVSETSFKFFTQFTSYASLYCGVCLATGIYSLVDRRNTYAGVDVLSIVLTALSGFFGSFCVIMSGTSIRFILENITNVDLLRKDHVYQLAVLLPTGTPSTHSYMTVSYPLQKHPLRPQPPPPTHPPSGTVDGGEAGQVGGDSRPKEQLASERDRLATRTFAVLRTEAGENPWDLGWKRNWTSVMGKNLFDWLFPIRSSPCARHDDMHSLYEMGPVLQTVKSRYGLPDAKGRSGGQEMSEKQMERRERWKRRNRERNRERAKAEAIGGTEGGG